MQGSKIHHGYMEQFSDKAIEEFYRIFIRKLARIEFFQCYLKPRLLLSGLADQQYPKTSKNKHRPQRGTKNNPVRKQTINTLLEEEGNAIDKAMQEAFASLSLEEHELEKLQIMFIKHIKESLARELDLSEQAAIKQFFSARNKVLVHRYLDSLIAKREALLAKKQIGRTQGYLYDLKKEFQNVSLTDQVICSIYDMGAKNSFFNLVGVVTQIAPWIPLILYLPKLLEYTFMNSGAQEAIREMAQETRYVSEFITRPLLLIFLLATLIIPVISRLYFYLKPDNFPTVSKEALEQEFQKFSLELKTALDSSKQATMTAEVQGDATPSIAHPDKSECLLVESFDAIETEERAAREPGVTQEFPQVSKAAKHRKQQDSARSQPLLPETGKIPKNVVPHQEASTQLVRAGFYEYKPKGSARNAPSLCLLIHMKALRKACRFLSQKEWKAYQEVEERIIAAMIGTCKSGKKLLSSRSRGETGFKKLGASEAFEDSRFKFKCSEPFRIYYAKRQDTVNEFRPIGVLHK